MWTSSLLQLKCCKYYGITSAVNISLVNETWTISFSFDKYTISKIQWNNFWVKENRFDMRRLAGEKTNNNNTIWTGCRIAVQCCMYRWYGRGGFPCHIRAALIFWFTGEIRNRWKKCIYVVYFNECNKCTWAQIPLEQAILQNEYNNYIDRTIFLLIHSLLFLFFYRPLSLSLIISFSLAHSLSLYIHLPCPTLPLLLAHLNCLIRVRCIE